MAPGDLGDLGSSGSSGERARAVELTDRQIRSATMDFDFSDEQVAFREEVERFLDDLHSETPAR